MNIRTSAKAIIINSGAVLLVEKNSSTGAWFALPGGGQQHGETLIDAIRRECREEIGRDVHVGDLLHVREYIGAHHEFAATDSACHQVEFWFACTLTGSTSAGDNRKLPRYAQAVILPEHPRNIWRAS
jgi:8-oxo-dGTP diphosphatase